MNNYIREPINGLTHLAGAILSFAGLLAMVIKASMTTSSTLAITSVIIFGISMILLYSIAVLSETADRSFYFRLEKFFHLYLHKIS